MISIQDAELDKAAKIKLFLNSQKKISYAITVQVKQNQMVKIDKLDHRGAAIDLVIATDSRGRFRLPEITIRSYFPFGLFRVWGYAFFKSDYYVYPKAIATLQWPEALVVQGEQEHLQIINQGDEIYELKSIDNPWAQPSRIAWKKAAQGQGWYTKHMSSPQRQRYWFSNKPFISKPLEEQLSMLCFLIKESEKNGFTYGLELGHIQTDFSQGERHLKHCLRLLAAYDKV